MKCVFWPYGEFTDSSILGKRPYVCDVIFTRNSNPPRVFSGGLLSLLTRRLIALGNIVRVKLR